ncbi:maleylpyruvate isomerase N-terminal domain-containing protein [Phycicoccus sonneratiae]|uniref:Maleylpyruvate isomerase N-terminal domain-containing protein n=1 Tax=Phycicoccus sonneratiae TaxID=2807628 RepID=A0ABS2CHH7_9MICO|nr:maleylpyruvate isomerase N-terminal domain-containing protein [Phycicoccus sonneraticus]MBM6399322.1 maleylpyruvate isomerase N-terminal domain-containing protein [Phycicoccus sonneraticus]
MGFTVPHEEALDAFSTSVDSFVEAARAVDELALFAPSRCHGWTRFEVVDHVLAGWRELLGGMAARTPGPATVDAVTYWTDWGEAHAADDPVAVLMAQRRHADAHPRPSAAVAALTEVAEQLRLVSPSLPDGHHAFQGQVLTSGDLLATWAVETVVHQLDLGIPHPPPAAALNLARRTAAEVPDLVGRA